jgi:hypothetical protein
MGSGGKYADRVKLRGKRKTRFQVSGVRQGINFKFKYQNCNLFEICYLVFVILLGARSEAIPSTRKFGNLGLKEFIEYDRL